MGLVYVTQFQVVSPSEGDAPSILEQLKQTSVRWADSAIRRQIDTRVPRNEKVPQFESVPVRGGRVEPRAGFSIETVGAESAKGNSIWRMVYAIPDDKQSHLEWVATVSLTQRDGETEFDFNVDVRPTSFVVSPRGIHPGTPSIVRDVIKTFDCRAGGVPLTAEPVILHESDIRVFVLETLPQERRLPVVLLSAGSPRRPFRTEAALASQLVGLAHVFALDNPATEDKLIAELGNKGFACFGGAVRTYWPAFDTKDVSWRHHPVAAPERISALGAEGFAALVRTSLSRLAVANYLSGSAYQAVRAEIEAEGRVRAEARRAELQSKSRNLEEAEAKNLSLAAELSTREENLRALEKTILWQDERIRELEGQVREQVFSRAVEDTDLMAGPTEETPDQGWPLPWLVERPVGVQLVLAPTFDDGLKVLQKDGSLRGDFLIKLAGILRDPSGVGQAMRAPRVGQRSTHVSHNYRLVWTPIDNGVRLEMFCSKEDPRYSPFGA